MEEEEDTDTIFDEREELMVSPTGEGAAPTLRIAHFLKPTIDAPKTLKPPSSISLISKRKVTLAGWRNPTPSWKDWVDRMRPLHQHTWRSAGIFESVIASTHTIWKHQDLIFALAEKWCSKTNTFMFPWGEATLTLEDMIVLGGYSVLGSSPISLPSDDDDDDNDSELVETEDYLNKQRKELIKTKSQKATHSLWLNHFMGSGSNNLEHEAFLSLWLSRFVFTEIYGIVPQHVLRVAVHLATGTKVALAPAVLASLYKNLSLLRNKMAKPSDHRHSEMALASPLKLVVVWVCERFPTLLPIPNVLGVDQPRLARWGEIKNWETDDVKSALERAGDIFLWRPYTLPVLNWSYPKFYREFQEEPVGVGIGVDDEIESFVRCLRAGELVGFDCIEQYSPHRVAMQFGFDQDIPGWVTPSNASHEIAWKRYSRPVCDDADFYIPSRLFESDVTVRYLEWWKKSVFCGSTRRQERKSKSRKPLKGSRGQGAIKKVKLPSIAKKKKLLEEATQTEDGKGRTETSADTVSNIENKTSVDDALASNSIEWGDGGGGTETAADVVNNIENKTSVGNAALGSNGPERGGAGGRETNRPSTLFWKQVDELEVRIGKIETIIAELKASGIGV